MKFRHRFALAAAISLCGLSPFSGQAAEDGNSALYRDLGGKQNIRRFTHDFLIIVLADDRIKDAFADTDMDRLEGLISDQLCDLSGGPCKYEGKDMHSAHKGREINTLQFNALAEDLQVAMENDGVTASASNQLIAKLAPMYGAVVEK